MYLSSAASPKVYCGIKEPNRFLLICSTFFHSHQSVNLSHSGNSLCFYYVACQGLLPWSPLKGWVTKDTYLTLPSHVKSQNHRIVGVGKDIWRTSSPTLGLCGVQVSPSPWTLYRCPSKFSLVHIREVLGSSHWLNLCQVPADHGPGWVQQAEGFVSCCSGQAEDFPPGTLTHHPSHHLLQPHIFIRYLYYVYHV